MYRRRGKCDRGSTRKEVNRFADLRFQISDREFLTGHTMGVILTRVLRILFASVRVAHAPRSNGASACSATEAR